MTFARTMLGMLAAGLVVTGSVDMARAQTCAIDRANPIVIPAGDDGAPKRAYRLPDGSIVFLGRFTIDADGSPHAYNPDNTGLDALSSAGRPGRWWALATDRRDCGPSGRPVLQQAGDPAPGFYVAKTSMENTAFSCRQQRRYVNSETISYVALSPRLTQINRSGGRLAVVQRGMSTGFALHADQAPASGYGEGSMELARTLGLNPSPRHGGTGNRELLYLILPQRMGFPPNNDAVQTASRTAFEAWGGHARLMACRAAVEAAPW